MSAHRSARRQRGVALLVVLILLVMMSVLAGRISQQFLRNLQKTRFQVSQQQLRWAIQGQASALKNRLEQRQGEQGKEPLNTMPEVTRGDFYTVVSTLTDAQTCFNVNSLLAEPTVVKGDAQPTIPSTEKPVKQQRFERVLAAAGIDSQSAETLYSELLDYLDADTTTASGVQESESWGRAVPATRPGDQMMVILNEIKRLPAFPARAWQKVSRLLCALPDTTSAVNLNGLEEEQAPLLSALYDGRLSEDDARRVIAARPPAGWESVRAFEEQLQKLTSLSPDVLKQSRAFWAVKSQFWRVDSIGTNDDLTLRVVTQWRIDASSGSATVWQQRYRISE